MGHHEETSISSSSSIDFDELVFGMILIILFLIIFY